MTRQCQWATVAPDLGLGAASCFRRELASGARFCQEHLDQFHKEALEQARKKKSTTSVRFPFVTKLVTNLVSGAGGAGITWVVDHWDEVVQVLTTIRPILTLGEKQAGELVIVLPRAKDEAPGRRFVIKNPDTWRPGEEFLIDYPPDLDDDFRREIESCSEPFAALAKLITRSVRD